MTLCLAVWEQNDYGREASFPFSKRLNSVIFRDLKFHCFLGIYAMFLRNAMSESAEITRVGLPIPH